MDKKSLLPVAEVFTSIHGEGSWAGTRMMFVRLAGCSVGKPTSNPVISPLPILHDNGHTAYKCRSWDGRDFICDTDFQLKEWWSVEQLVKRAVHEGVEHVCLTGGEPFIHLETLRREAFFKKMGNSDIKTHVETSGTIAGFPPLYVYLTVSPKLGVKPTMISRADEVRLIITSNFNPLYLPKEVLIHPNVYVSPVNDIQALNHDSEVMRLCMKLLEDHPNWKFNAQIHKVYGWK